MHWKSYFPFSSGYLSFHFLSSHSGYSSPLCCWINGHCPFPQSKCGKRSIAVPQIIFHHCDTQCDFFINVHQSSVTKLIVVSHTLSASLKVIALTAVKWYCSKGALDPSPTYFLQLRKTILASFLSWTYILFFRLLDDFFHNHKGCSKWFLVWSSDAIRSMTSMHR